MLKKDLWLDRVYKLSAPLMLGIVAYSYVYSVKPIFDKQQELNDTSSLAVSLAIEVQNLEKDRTLAQYNLGEVNQQFQVVKNDLKKSNESLALSSMKLNEITASLTEKKSELSVMKATIRKQNSDILNKEKQLTNLLDEVKQKNITLNELNKSLTSSENAAVSFYVYRVVNEITNEGINSSIYNSSYDKFNLYDELMEKSRINESENVDMFSQKYYENEAKVIIRQFAIDKVSKTETSYKQAFELYTYTLKKQLGMPI
ncbi:Chromosome partition protein Smc [Vibrio crassostreae]|uniref:hypothetical protein n=1 Tax=Vibrio crassostreae TaxID=246167 RepID=UPI0005DB92A0|nr:hypothetical protein [Vibrio crassostreae]TDW03005.1 hypothetical protein EDB45_12824 [Vibrio crassostreae]CAK1950850.1 Chromosome partition protein Smc [Vibrio crassostreae]CAK1950957.1 Chromosome partition protein Smc [Vibrio crassostreae]CAK2027208.1 Chromosome partition protein Smc [Vibrio crassostreae]CAK2036867.1 Chromosome partition protein Smc [Vibrio crassostreae]